MAQPNANPPKGTNPATLSGNIQGFAILIILVWLGVLAWLGLYHIKEEEIHWARLTFLFNSLEAVVFAAAGALFGTQVQRARVEKAENTAKKGVKFAALYKESSPDMQTMFDLPQLNFTKSKIAKHVQMQQLADDILADAAGN
jgi:hypothetical protein